LSTLLSLSIFGRSFAAYEENNILNFNEDAIYFDMPPSRIWADRSGGSAHVVSMKKHTWCVTAVLTVRADGALALRLIEIYHFYLTIHVDFVVLGRKIPILSIVRGKPGGIIDTEKQCENLREHYYMVQENVWMDVVVC
jgi:hypothetical protein